MHQHEEEIRPFAEWMEARKPVNVLEIGSLHGGTTVLWGGIAPGLIVSIDLPDGRFGARDHGLHIRAMERRNARLLSQIGLRFHSVLGDSHDPAVAQPVWDLLQRRVDLLFIDGDHTYEGVLDDFERYHRMVRPGGVIAFHDILDTELHRNAGCRVDQLWNELKVRDEFIAHEWSINSTWGGIGALEVRQ
jgi:cephalosporin hydroxylase